MVALPLAFDFLSCRKNISPETFSVAVFVLSNEVVAGFVVDAAAALGEVVGPLAFEDVAVVENDNAASVFEVIFPMALEEIAWAIDDFTFAVSFALLKVSLIGLFRQCTYFYPFSMFFITFPLALIPIAIDHFLNTKPIPLPIAKLSFIPIHILVNLNAISLPLIIDPLPDINQPTWPCHLAQPMLEPLAVLEFELTEVMGFGLMGVGLVEGLCREFADFLGEEGEEVDVLFGEDRGVFLLCDGLLLVAFLLFDYRLCLIFHMGFRAIN